MHAQQGCRTGLVLSCGARLVVPACVATAAAAAVHDSSPNGPSAAVVIVVGRHTAVSRSEMWIHLVRKLAPAPPRPPSTFVLRLMVRFVLGGHFFSFFLKTSPHPARPAPDTSLRRTSDLRSTAARARAPASTSRWRCTGKCAARGASVGAGCRPVRVSHSPRARCLCYYCSCCPGVVLLLWWWFCGGVCWLVRGPSIANGITLVGTYLYNSKLRRFHAYPAACILGQR